MPRDDCLGNTSRTLPIPYLPQKDRHIVRICRRRTRHEGGIVVWNTSQAH